MNKIRPAFIVVFLAFSGSVKAFELGAIAQEYYSAWVETQKPKATEKALDSYLAFLKKDVGHQHLPYDPESNREPNNRLKMREGMGFYLGSHLKYSSTLESVVTGYNLIVIKYNTKSEGIHPQTKELIKQDYDTVEVLEIEDGKVAVIRKYSE